MALARKLKRTMSPADRARLSQQIQEEQDYKAGLARPLQDGITGPDGGLEGKPVNTHNIDVRVNRMQNVLKDGTPDKFSRKETVEAEKEAREHKEWLEKHMLTQREMDLMPRDGYEFSRAVRKTTAQEVGSPEFQKRAGRYRELMRRIAPDDPEAQSIEALRPVR